MPEKKTLDVQPETVAAAYGVASDTAYGAVAPPLYLSSTYEFPGFDTPGAYDYGRVGNPTRDLLGEAIARLEGGAGAVLTPSGMARSIFWREASATAASCSRRTIATAARCACSPPARSWASSR